MERRNPDVRELLMVLMAPAPGVKLIRTPAPARASQRENCTCQVYAGRPLARHHRVVTGSKACKVLIRRHQGQTLHHGLRCQDPVKGILVVPVELSGGKPVRMR